jgi:hypothetical protein
MRNHFGNPADGLNNPSKHGVILSVLHAKVITFHQHFSIVMVGRFLCAWMI